MNTPGSFSGLFQMAYVTTDIDQAIAHFAEHQGIGQFLVLRDLPIQTGPGREATLNVALAYAGDWQVELIEPRGGDDLIYRQPLPQSEFGLAFHHVAQSVPSAEVLARIRAEQLRLGHAIVIEGKSPGNLDYFYSDHRQTLGHCIEHCYYTEQGLAFLAQIPRNSRN